MVEFQYFDGCPNSEETLKNLRELVRSGVIAEEDLIVTEVPDPASAEKLNFQGSPTILLDGVDIYTGRKPAGSNFSCRVYRFDGRSTGVIPGSFIAKRIGELHPPVK